MGMLFALQRLMRVVVLLPIVFAVPANAQDAKPYSKEQLDQMTAQVALYPDSLLSQLFMATTYPDEFAEAYKWSKAHPDAKGDDAVRMVENQNWDPSVASMVGFPEVLITLGEKTDWVKNMGDAFLAQPEDVMDSVQRLRAQAQTTGNLKSNEQVKVSTETPRPPQAGAPAPPPPVIVIEPAQPTVVYVPVYNPAIVYGVWPYPAYPPYYYPPPPGYWWSRAVATGIAWGVGIGVSNALWGGFNWGRGDVNINVNRYNNINVNNRLDVNGGRANWNHNPEHRKTAYRGGDQTRQNLNRQYQAGSREQYRGRDAGRDASRERASQAMQSRGIESPGGSARDREQAMKRDMTRQQQGGNRDAAHDRAQSVDRNAALQRAQSSNRDNALRGAGGGQARAQADRGAASHAAAQRGGSARAGGDGGGGARAGGGGGARGGGGGGRGR